MISALFRAFLQLTDPDVRRVIWVSIGATIVGFTGLAVGVAFSLHMLHLTRFDWFEPALDALGGIAVLGFAWLLFPAVVPALSSLFLDDVTAAVERRYYPGLPRPHPQPLGEALLAAVRYLLISVALNLLVLPLYLVPGINLVVFLMLNGYLLGRQYWEQVAARHVDSATMNAGRRQQRPTVILAGVVISAMAALPVVNLIVPVVATAFMAHLFLCSPTSPRFLPQEH